LKKWLEPKLPGKFCRQNGLGLVSRAKDAKKTEGKSFCLRRLRVLRAKNPTTAKWKNGPACTQLISVADPSNRLSTGKTEHPFSRVIKT